MSRPLTLVTYLLALVMIVTLSHNPLAGAHLPRWVLIVSIIFVSGLRRQAAGDPERVDVVRV